MARPFLKWAGGKAKLAPRVLELAPGEFGRYHEPFCGAGAVFFAMHEALPGLRATLSDANPRLIACFEAVRGDVEGVIEALQPLADRYLPAAAEERKELYYAVRAEEPASRVEAAARLIFLNKTCFNGLYRENAAGRFNVPHGRYAHPRILDAEALRSASKALQAAGIRARDFEAACAEAERGDFVYLDPPYHPLSTTSSFTAYTRGDFGMDDQFRLRETFDKLTKRGIRALLSNSDHPVIRELYAGRGYRLEVVPMSRAINSKPEGRAAIGELLIANW